MSGNTATKLLLFLVGLWLVTSRSTFALLIFLWLVRDYYKKTQENPDSSFITILSNNATSNNASPNTLRQIKSLENHIKPT